MDITLRRDLEHGGVRPVSYINPKMEHLLNFLKAEWQRSRRAPAQVDFGGTQA